MTSPLSNPQYTYNNASGTSYMGKRPVPELVGTENISPPDDYVKFYPMWLALRDLYDGELAIKRGGELYLRKLSSHSDSEYAAYLHRAPFYNGVRRTHAGLMGSLFRKEPEFENSPPRLETILGPSEAPVTTCGLTRYELLRKIAHELLLTGRLGLLSDLHTDPNNPNLPAKPSIAIYRAEDVFSWRYRLIGGHRLVDRVILRERHEEMTAYSVKHFVTIRVLRLDPDPSTPSGLRYSQDVYRRNENGTVTFQKIDPTVRGVPLDHLPFEFVNSDGLNVIPSAPPMTDLATMNLNHYESSALLAHALFYAGMPTYYIAGEQEDPLLGIAGGDKMAVGPSSIWRLNKDDKAGVLEFTGHGLTFLENGVADKQAQMQSLGGRIITSQRRTASLSPEAYGIMEMSDQSILLDIAVTTERAYTRAMRHCATLADIQLTPTQLDQTFVEINKEFDNGQLSAREMRAIQTLYERGLIPLDVLYYTLRQIGVIPMEYSLEEFKSLLNAPGQTYDDPKLALEQQRIDDQRNAAEDQRTQNSQTSPDQTGGSAQ